MVLPGNYLLGCIVCLLTVITLLGKVVGFKIPRDVVFGT